MVPRNQLPASREELLSKAKHYNVQIPDRTKEEMMAGQNTVALAWVTQCVDSGLIMLRKRYERSSFVFTADLIKTGWRNWDVVLQVKETPLNPSYEPKLLVEFREEADKFISEEMLTKIIMVCG